MGRREICSKTLVPQQNQFGEIARHSILNRGSQSERHTGTFYDFFFLFFLFNIFYAKVHAH